MEGRKRRKTRNRKAKPGVWVCIPHLQCHCTRWVPLLTNNKNARTWHENNMYISKRLSTSVMPCIPMKSPVRPQGSTLFFIILGQTKKKFETEALKWLVESRCNWTFYSLTLPHRNDQLQFFFSPPSLKHFGSYIIKWCDIHVFKIQCSLFLYKVSFGLILLRV